MGTVYRAHDTLLERDVALKILSKAGLGTEGRTRLLHEARAAAQLNHPNIVSVYDAGEDQGTSFIVMELVEEETLFDRKPDSLDEILSIARQICAALEHAHAQGVVHRDLKPENIIITHDGTAKLTDFGLARSMASRITTDGTIVGTVFYLSPEQALGQSVDGRADLYALGVTLYELLARRLPFTGDDPLPVISQHLYAPAVPASTYNTAISPALDALILQLLSKQPEDRPASAAAVRQILDHLVAPERAGIQDTPLHYPGHSPLNQLVRGRLVGRAREFAEARALWTQSMAALGENNVLLISGEPGVGKTPVVREIQALAKVSGGVALMGECYAQGSAPYAPLAQVVREALPLLRAHLPELVLAGLITLAPDLRARYPDVSPSPPLDPQAEQQRLFESVVSLCAALTDRAPLLLVVEDVHWADDGTLFLLRHLARRARAAKLSLLIVLTYREVDLDHSCCLPDVLLDLNREQLAVRIKLARFTRDQTREFLNVLLQEEVTDGFLDAIFGETEGNLFFIEELCRTLIEEGKLFRTNGRWRQLDMTEIQLPQSVRLAIQLRVSKLPAVAQDVLRLAAVVGREFDFETLQQAGEMDEEVLIDALEAAEHAQLIGEVKRAGREAFAFAHGLTVTTLRESVSGLRRRRLHRRVADAIETLRPDDLEALAYHYGAARDEESALAYTLRAAHRARSVYANEEALRLFGDALDLMPDGHPDRFDVLAARSQVYDLVARREAQHADVDAMLALSSDLNDDTRLCDALMALADFYLETDPFRAREPAQRAVTIARELADPVREAHALRRLGREARYRYDYPHSLRALEGAAERFHQAGLSGEAAVCLHMLSLTLGSQGDNAAALEAAQDALASSRTAGDRRQEAISLRRLAIVYLNTFEHAQALPFAEAALALHRELGDRSEECKALNVLGVITGWLGRAADAERYLFQSLELAQAIGSSTGVRAAVVNLIWSHFQPQGEYEAALAFLEEQLTKACLTDDRFLVAHLQSQKPHLLALLGQHALALDLEQTLLPTIDRVLGQTIHARSLSFTGRLHAELGDFRQAHQYLDRALQRLGETDSALDAASLLTDRACVALLEGGEANLRLGLDQANRAIALLQDSAWVGELAVALDTVARLHLALGQEDHVDAALANAAQALHLVAKWPFLPEGCSFTHSRALRAAGREVEADDALRRAYERVMLVAGKTQDESLRGSWLEDVRLNREILAEWVLRRAQT